MVTNNDNVTSGNASNMNDVPPMVCPICNKSFYDLKSFAAHISNHYEDEKKQRLDEEKKQKEDQRKKDIDKLLQLNAEVRAAEKRYDAALNQYKEKYGGLVFPTNNFLLDRILDMF